MLEYRDDHNNMILKGEKTILRPIKLSDAPRFVKWLADPKVTTYLRRHKVSLKDEKKWIRMMQKSKRHKVFSIDTRDDIHIGRVWLDSIDKRDKNAGMVIMIGDKKYWSRGHGTDATKTILSYGFNKLKLHSINLWVYDFNSRAIRVYKKLGFRTVGRKRECVRRNRKYYDAINMDILDREWEKITPTLP